ncbi:alpha/beta hydrolase [Oryzifoliimicrobium ureilyticus]|uniref:alpha/beta hydrolase n=1 Tax=Oryzifoliimicrobium ureilyticus TaxID=3113724 RepID=UPI0030762E31
MPVHITPASANPVLDTLTQEFLDRFPGPATSMEEMRQRMLDTSAPPVGDVEVTNIALTPDQIRASLMRPKSVSLMGPVLVFFCTARGDEQGQMNAVGLCRALSVSSQMAVLCLDTSQGQLSVRVARALSAVSEIQKSGRALGLDTSRIAVAGDGVGANIAAIVSMIGKDLPDPSIALQILFNPILSAQRETPSFHAFSEGPWLTRALMSEIFSELDAIRSKDLPSPSDARVRELDGMPATLLITAENDMARDEAETFALKLMQAGNRVSAVRFLGTIHDFAVLGQLADTPAAQGAVAQAAAILKETFK